MSREKAMFSRWSKIFLLFVSSVLIAWLHTMQVEEAIKKGGLSHGQDYIAIRIQDHGTGMDRETVENMFTPFYSNKNNGTGLGTSFFIQGIQGG